MARNEGSPDWMRQEYAERDTRGSRQQPHSYVTSDLSPLHAAAREESVAFPRSVITGVKIIAWLMLLNTSIGVAFVMVSLFPPSGTETGFGSVVTAGDYFSIGRIFVSLVVGLIIAIGVWKIVETSD